MAEKKPPNPARDWEEGDHSGGFDPPSTTAGGRSPNGSSSGDGAGDEESTDPGRPAPPQIDPAEGKKFFRLALLLLAAAVLLVSCLTSPSFILVTLLTAAGFVVLLAAAALVLLLAFSGAAGKKHENGHGASTTPHLDGIHGDDLGIVKIPGSTSGFVPMGGNFDVPVIRHIFGGGPRDFFPRGEGSGRIWRIGRHYFVLPVFSEVFFVDASQKKIIFLLRIAPQQSPIVREVPGNVWVRAIGGQGVTAKAVDALTGSHDVPLSEAVQTVLGQVVTHFEAAMPESGLNSFLNAQEARILSVVNKELHHYGVEVVRLHFDAVNDEVAAQAAKIKALREQGVNPNMVGGSTGGGSATGGFGGMIEAALAGWLSDLAKKNGNNNGSGSNTPGK